MESAKIKEHSPVKGDSAVILLAKCSDNVYTKEWGQMKKRWLTNYFPNTFPRDFHFEREDFNFKNIQWVESPDFQLSYDVSSIKSKKHNFYMKIIHPRPFFDLIELIQNQQILKADELKDALEETDGIFHVFSSTSLLYSKRRELLSTGEATKLTRLDINKYFASFYTHFMEALRVGNVLTARQDFDPKVIGRDPKWSHLLDSAIRACQHGETHGLPISGDLYRAVGEIVLLFIDAIIARRIKRLDYEDKIAICRKTDNYDIFAHESIANDVVDIFMQVFHSFQLSLNVCMVNVERSIDCFPLAKAYKESMDMNCYELKKFLDDHSEDPDYVDIVEKICDEFFTRYITKYKEVSDYMPSLMFILSTHPLSIQYFAESGIRAFRAKTKFPSQKLGTKLLRAYKMCPFKSLPTTQLVCICHYYLIVKMEQQEMQKLQKFLESLKMDRCLIVRQYMIKFGFNTSNLVEQKASIDQFKFENDNWLTKQILIALNGK